LFVYIFLHITTGTTDFHFHIQTETQVRIVLFVFPSFVVVDQSPAIPNRNKPQLVTILPTQTSTTLNKFPARNISNRSRYIRIDKFPGLHVFEFFFTFVRSYNISTELRKAILNHSLCP
jgi:hypothetical protein